MRKVNIERDVFFQPCIEYGRFRLVNLRASAANDHEVCSGPFLKNLRERAQQQVVCLPVFVFTDV